MANDDATVFQRLSGPPVLGQDLANVAMLRLDRLGGPAPGNKLFKLRPFLDEAATGGASRLLSFGGAWSNHLHALAGYAAELDLETVGFVRGAERDTAMLEDARRWGMRIVPLSRADYRQRHDRAFQQALLDRYGPGLLIPEGGADAKGIRGCLSLAQLVNTSSGHWDRVVLAVGTGTTLAGLAAGLAPGTQLVGVSALKNAHDLERRVEEGLVAADLHATVPWQILHDYHCGGFARVDARLRAFMLAFEATRGVPLDPVYTGKALLAIHDLLARGVWRRDERILMIHSGGLQGRRGYTWLDSPAQP